MVDEEWDWAERMNGTPDLVMKILHLADLHLDHDWFDRPLTGSLILRPKWPSTAQEKPTAFPGNSR